MIYGYVPGPKMKDWPQLINGHLSREMMDLLSLQTLEQVCWHIGRQNCAHATAILGMISRLASLCLQICKAPTKTHSCISCSDVDFQAASCLTTPGSGRFLGGIFRFCLTMNSCEQHPAGEG